MTKAEKAYCARVVALGCAICRRLGLGETPCEIHHMRAGQGKMRAPHSMAIGLCPEHHRGKTGIHGLGTKCFPVVYGVTEAELVEQTKVEAGWPA
jgi:hypothetical protein